MDAKDVTVHEASYPERVPSIPEEPSATDAIERAVEAAQRIVVDRIELLRLEAEDALARTLRGTLLVAVGAILALIGWCVLVALAVELMRERGSLTAALAAVGLFHASIGVAIATFGIVSARSRQR